MIEQEAKNNPEMKVILLLSGFARELGEGQDFENTIYKYASDITELFTIPDQLIKKYKNRIAKKQRERNSFERQGMSGACLSLTGEIQAYNAVIKDLQNYEAT